MSAVQKIEPRQEIVSAQPVTPMEMLASAIDKGMAIETIDKLVALAERWDKTNARKAFDEAIAAAKAAIPPILKNREVDFTSQKGRTHYRHEDMAEIARTVDPILGKHGLSYRYRVTSNVNEPISVTCILSHRQGHYEETTLHGGRDDTGNKNSLQGIGSTITYLQRYTLKAALGLSVSADDGGKAGGNVGAKITAEEAESIANIIATISGLPQDAEKNPVRDRLLRWVSTASRSTVEHIADIPSQFYDGARKNLETLAAAKAKS